MAVFAGLWRDTGDRLALASAATPVLSTLTDLSVIAVVGDSQLALAGTAAVPSELPKGVVGVVLTLALAAADPRGAVCAPEAGTADGVPRMVGRSTRS